MTYRITAANAMCSLLDTKVPRLDKLTTAASIGCQTLTDLSNDSEFKEMVSQLCHRRLADPAGRNLAVRTLGHFSSFLEKEKELMLKSDMIPRLVKELARQAKLLLEPVKKWHGDPDTMFVMIEQVRDDTCALADSLKRELRENKGGWTPEQKSIARRILLRVAYVLGGLALIGLSSPNPDFLSIAEAISLALGGAFLGQALPPPPPETNIETPLPREEKPEDLPKKREAAKRIIMVPENWTGE